MDLFWRGGVRGGVELGKCTTPPPRWDCGVATKTKGQYCCFAVRTLDCGLSSIPAVNSIRDFLHCFSSVSFNNSHLPIPPSPPPLSCPYGWREEVEPKCAMSATCFYPPHSSLRPFSFDFSPILLRRVHLSALLPLRECNTVGPQPNDPIDSFCVMYSIILLLMTEKIY